MDRALERFYREAPDESKVEEISEDELHAVIARYFPNADSVIDNLVADKTFIDTPEGRFWKSHRVEATRVH